jgi:hypothetical protein
VEAFRLDSALEGAPLPFVVWESHRPAPDAAEQERALWHARLRLFARLGAQWIAGLTFLSPDFRQVEDSPVPLQLFLLPVEVPASAFDGAALRDVAAGLFRRVYGIAEGDPLFEESLPPGCRPTLQPAEAASV